MNTELFIVNKLVKSVKGTFSGFIIRISIIAITLSIATMIIASSMVNGFQKEIRNKVFGFWNHISITPYTLNRSLEDEGLYKKRDFYVTSKKYDEIESIHASALKAGLLRAGDEIEGVALKGVCEDYNPDLLKPYIKKGQFPSLDSTKNRKDILISTSLAEKLNIDTGSKVNISFPGQNLRVRPFRVSGIYETGLEEVDNRYVITDLAVIQDLNSWGPDTIGFFEVRLKEKELFKSRAKTYFLIFFGRLYSEEEYYQESLDPVDKIAASISGKMNDPELDVQTIKSNFPGIFDWLDMQNMNELIIITLMFLVAAINMITSLLILIIERTKMIGALKSLGATDFSIRKIFIYFSAYIIGLGMFFGNVIGLGVCYLQKYTTFIKLPKESYYLDAAPVDISFSWIIFLNVVSITLCLLLMFFPTLLVSKITPVKTLQFD